MAGTPINMPTHAHGQGYSDNNFLIPELVRASSTRRARTSAEEGDFSAAGAINVNYLSVLDHRHGQGRGGTGPVRPGALRRIVEPRGAAISFTLARPHHSDGPWQRGDDYRKWNGVLRFSRGTSRTDSVSPRWRIRADGTPPTRYPTARSRAAASTASAPSTRTDCRTDASSHAGGERRKSTGAGLTLVKAYAIDYGLQLFSNFTYFLEDPLHGDQFEQKDDRASSEAASSQRFLGTWFGKDTESVVGLQGRFDRIPTIGLYHTAGARSGCRRSARIASNQSSGALYFQTSIQWASKLRTVAGVRGDAVPFRRVDGDDPLNSGTRSATLASPKLSVVLGPWRSTEVYANWGWGFHSNDARGSVQTRDPEDGRARCRPSIRSCVRKGAEVGLRLRWPPAVIHSTLALSGARHRFRARSSSATRAPPKPSRPSRRIGVEWSNAYVTLSRFSSTRTRPIRAARFRDADPAGDRIPGAVEGVLSAGITVAGDGPSGSLRLRYFGPRPLIEDDSVRSKASTTLNGRASFRLSRRYGLAVDLFNSRAPRSATSTTPPSRLSGEPSPGIDDIHTHPLEPFTVRVSFTASF